MQIIKNHKLIEKLIKEGYKIPIKHINYIDVVLTRTNSKTVEDWEKIIKYLQKYTKESKKTLNFWNLEYSCQAYWRYLEVTKDFKEFEKFPKEDIYYLSEAIEKAKKENYEKIILKKADDILEKEYKYTWARTDKVE